MSNLLILSIVVPVYKVELYLEKCLDSLLTQDISSDEYEIICVDDGSPDRCPEILEKYASEHKNLIVIHKENGGLSSARNCGIDKAKGKYIWFVDSDDFIKENSLSKIVSVLRENDYDKIQFYPYVFEDKKDDFDPDKIMVSMSQSRYKNVIWMHIFRRDIILDNKVYFPDKVSYIEDALFYMQVTPAIKNSIKLDEVIYFYRLRENSLMTHNAARKIDSRIKGAMICDEICDGKRFGDVEAARWFKYKNMSIMMTDIANLPKSERKKYVSKLKTLGMFPLKYNAKLTPKTDYSNKTIANKLRVVLSNISYCGPGYRMLVFWLFVLKCGRRVKNIFPLKK